MKHRLSGGRAFRAYRFPQRKGGRLSRRPGTVGTIGPIASGLTAFMLAMLAMGGVAAAAVWGYFSADLPGGARPGDRPGPLSTHIYDRTGEHLLYTLEDERRELITLGEVPVKMQAATTDIEDKTFLDEPGDRHRRDHSRGQREPERRHAGRLDDHPAAHQDAPPR